MFYVSRLAGRGEQDAALPPPLTLLQQAVQQGGAHPFPGVPRVPRRQVHHNLENGVSSLSSTFFGLWSLGVGSLYYLGPDLLVDSKFLVFIFFLQMTLGLCFWDLDLVLFFVLGRENYEERFSNIFQN